jgi:hypothetical protein
LGAEEGFGEEEAVDEEFGKVGEEEGMGSRTKEDQREAALKRKGRKEKGCFLLSMREVIEKIENRKRKSSLVPKTSRRHMLSRCSSHSHPNLNRPELFFPLFTSLSLCRQLEANLASLPPVELRHLLLFEARLFP